MPGHSIAVLIPCYNEALTIAKVVDDFHAALPQATIYSTTTTQPMTPPPLQQPMAP